MAARAMTNPIDHVRVELHHRGDPRPDKSHRRHPGRHRHRRYPRAGGHRGCSWPSATTPRNELITGQVDLDGQGYVTVQPASTATTLAGSYAAGDLVDHTYRQAIHRRSSGCAAALDAEHYLRDLDHTPTRTTHTKPQHPTTRSALAHSRPTPGFDGISTHHHVKPNIQQEGSPPWELPRRPPTRPSTPTS